MTGEDRTTFQDLYQECYEAVKDTVRGNLDDDFSSREFNNEFSVAISEDVNNIVWAYSTREIVGFALDGGQFYRRLKNLDYSEDDDIVDLLKKTLEAEILEKLYEATDTMQEELEEERDERSRKACEFSSEDCSGPLWECESCHRKFCSGHTHKTSLGWEVECADCEIKRLDLE